MIIVRSLAPARTALSLAPRADAWRPRGSDRASGARQAALSLRGRPSCMAAAAAGAPSPSRTRSRYGRYLCVGRSTRGSTRGRVWRPLAARCSPPSGDMLAAGPLCGGRPAVGAAPLRSHRRLWGGWLLLQADTRARACFCPAPARVRPSALLQARLVRVAPPGADASALAEAALALVARRAPREVRKGGHLRWTWGKLSFLGSAAALSATPAPGLVHHARGNVYALAGRAARWLAGLGP